MNGHAARWGLVGLLGVAAIVAVAASRGDAPEPVVGVSPRPAAMPERAPAPDADSALREAALARFKNGSTGLRLNDGTRIAPRDAEHEAHIKVNLFKKVLARELAQKDPTFVQAAEQSLRRKRPAELVVEWDELTGNPWVRFVVSETADCAFPEGPEARVEAGGLSRHPCLLRSSLKSRWPEGNPALRVEVLPLAPDSRDWKRLMEEEMKELAALDFLRARGHRLAAVPAAGRTE
ncbi:hypothetical protein [Pyxidicoccus trucidator]|uniref:hypothetical protein n=1 Tax=Pyxidicoccus trucidator TaxID=2709662 RepID=UPI0013DA0BD9|nr:hypothetical protein [Pyxidicoccus trucidator]